MEGGTGGRRREAGGREGERQEAGGTVRLLHARTARAARLLRAAVHTHARRALIRTTVAARTRCARARVCVHIN